MSRDRYDHIRFCPIQSNLAKELCHHYGMPLDASTAVLIDEAGAHTSSSAILRLFPWMGFPFALLGPVALKIPLSLRDNAYYAFVRRRGAIWKFVMKLTGWRTPSMQPYRARIVGLDQEKPLPPGWGFDEEDEKTNI